MDYEVEKITKGLIEGRAVPIIWHTYAATLAVLVLISCCDGQEIRIATFNASLYRQQSGQLQRELAAGDSIAAKKVAQILQVVRPDIVLLNEFDYEPDGKSIELFRKKYLEVPQGKNGIVEYPFQFLAPVNTGVASGLDLDGNGKIGGPGDAWGYGKFPGQYGFAVLSRFPVEQKACRSFQKFVWQDMPDAWLPRNGNGDHFYSEKVRKVFRLSSKNHCDVVIRIGNHKKLHFLVSHPTPPVFDGKEDRNGRRNHDEIRFWNDYVTPELGAYIYDDLGRRGGLTSGEKFVIAGDLNADPLDGDSSGRPIKMLAKNRLINFEVQPQSKGAVEAARQGPANRRHQGDPALDTADFNDATVGNLRTDYVLPSAHLKVNSSGVFWPTKTEAAAQLIGVSDHRLVWIDLTCE